MVPNVQMMPCNLLVHIVFNKQARLNTRYSESKTYFVSTSDETQLAPCNYSTRGTFYIILELSALSGSFLHLDDSKNNTMRLGSMSKKTKINRYLWSGSLSEVRIQNSGDNYSQDNVYGCSTSRLVALVTPGAVEVFKTVLFSNYRAGCSSVNKSHCSKKAETIRKNSYTRGNCNRTSLVENSKISVAYTLGHKNSTYCIISLPILIFVFTSPCTNKASKPRT